MWDLGYGFEMEQVTLSSYIVLGLSVVLTIFTLIVV